MKQEDKLRNTLREYYDNQQVPFENEDWQQASAQLASARNKGRKRRFAIVFIVLLAVFSALFITVFGPSESTANKKPQVLSRSFKNLKPAPVSKPGFVDEPQVTTQKITPDTKPSKSVPLFAPAEARETQVLKIGSPSNIDVSSVSTSIALPEQDPGTLQKNDGAGVEAKNTDSAITSFSPANETRINAEGEATGVSSDVPGQPGATVEIKTLPAETVVIEQSNDQLKEMLNESVNAVRQTTVNLALTDVQQKALVTDTDNNSPVIKVADTTGIAEIKVRDTLLAPVTYFDPIGEGIFLEAGGAWFYGWKGPLARDARGFSPLIGVSYMNRLGGFSAFSFGLSYVIVPNLSNSSKTSRISSYEYGEQSSVTVITPSSVHYLVAPLRFHFAVSHWNSFGIGVNLAYLFNVYATVTNYNEAPGSSTDYKTSKLGGYTEGFSRFDAQLALCYRRRLGNSMALQAEIFSGLMDVKQDAFFNFSNKEKNSGAKLSLIYYPFRKNKEQ